MRKLSLKQMTAANAEQLRRDERRAASRPTSMPSYTYKLAPHEDTQKLPSLMWVSDELLRSMGFVPEGNPLPAGAVMLIRNRYTVMLPSHLLIISPADVAL